MEAPMDEVLKHLLNRIVELELQVAMLKAQLAASAPAQPAKKGES